jgi:hypothetical protein
MSVLSQARAELHGRLADRAQGKHQTFTFILTRVKHVEVEGEGDNSLAFAPQERQDGQCQVRNETPYVMFYF